MQQPPPSIQPAARRAAHRADAARGRAGRTGRGGARVRARPRAGGEDRPRAASGRTSGRRPRWPPRSSGSSPCSSRWTRGTRRTATAAATPACRSDVNQLQSDVNQLERQVSGRPEPEQRRRLAAVRDQGPAQADLRRPAAAGAGHPERAAGPLRAERPGGPGRAGSGGRGRRRAIAAAAKIVALPGDGIGPEVVGAGLQLLDALASRFDSGFEIEQAPVGGVSIDEHGVPLLPEVLERAAHPTRCCWARWAGPSGTRPTPTRPARSRDCSACARGSACSRTCDRCGSSRRSRPPARCARSARAART